MGRRGKRNVAGREKGRREMDIEGLKQRVGQARRRYREI